MEDYTDKRDLCVLVLKYFFKKIRGENTREMENILLETPMKESILINYIWDLWHFEIIDEAHCNNTLTDEMCNNAIAFIEREISTYYAYNSFYDLPKINRKYFWEVINHGMRVCRYGEKCTRTKCWYNHPNGINTRKCKYGRTCTRNDCWFSHPEPIKPALCRFGFDCKRGNACFFRH